MLKEKQKVGYYLMTRIKIIELKIKVGNKTICLKEKRKKKKK